SSKVPISPPRSAPQLRRSSRSARSTSGRFGTIRYGSRARSSRYRSRSMATLPAFAGPASRLSGIRLSLVLGLDGSYAAGGDADLRRAERAGNATSSPLRLCVACGRAAPPRDPASRRRSRRRDPLASLRAAHRCTSPEASRPCPPRLPSDSCRKQARSFWPSLPPGRNLQLAAAYRKCMLQITRLLALASCATIEAVTTGIALRDRARYLVHRRRANAAGGNPR